ncbi:RBR-type E3 ubiquitin transferase [Trifolium repens]|nr:RBR-type E3 ubiquitin transferase [Trifolium repens]
MGNNLCILHCIPIKTKKRKNKKQNLSSPSFSNPSPNLTLDKFFETNEITIPTPLPIKGVPFYDCEICYESKPLNDSFNIEGCTHFFCTKCTIKYIVSKLQENKVILNCPESGCSGVLNPQYCKPILPNNVLNWWEKALSESVVPEKNKFYCPFYNCSALLFSDDNHYGKVIEECTCPHCKRSFCVKCKTPWHKEMSCEKFQRLKHSNDALMLDLADRKKWKECPNCRHLIEKSQGCNHMKCRCSYMFCYQCGRGINPPHKSCDH